METITKPKTKSARTGMPAGRFDQELHALHDLLDGELLVSQDRCVDALLDLYNAAPTTLLRELVAEMISDIRFVSAVRAQLLRDDVTLLTSYR